MTVKINIVVYMINNTNGFQIPIAQTSIKLEEVYTYKPICIWLPLKEPDQVSKNLRY